MFLRKSVLLLVGIVAFCAVLTGCGGLFNDDVSRDRIVEYVNENHELLESVTKDEIPGEDAERESWIRDRLGKQTIVKSVYRYNDNIIKFYCGGTGLATNSTYSGFYYSADDTPFALEFPTDELTETSPGVYEWKSNTGEEIITERILPNWFYYHQIWY